MFEFGIKSNLDQLTKAFDKMASGQVPFATSLALNRCLQLARTTLLSTMQREFNAPTPFILNSLFTKNSTKTNLVGTVGHKQSADGRLPPSAPLRAEIEGGGRAMKSLEKQVGSYLMPSRVVRLDAYGNVPGSLVRSIGAAISSGGTGRGGKEYVVLLAGNPRGLAPGIYQVLGGASAKGKDKRSTGRLVPIFFFSRAPHYSKRYDIEGVVQRVVNAEFGNQFAAAMDYALSTAKVKLPT